MNRCTRPSTKHKRFHTESDIAPVDNGSTLPSDLGVGEASNSFVDYCTAVTGLCLGTRFPSPIPPSHPPPSPSGSPATTITPPCCHSLLVLTVALETQQSEGSDTQRERGEGERQREGERGREREGGREGKGEGGREGGREREGEGGRGREREGERQREGGKEGDRL